MKAFLQNHFEGVPNGWITLWTKNSKTGESRTTWYDLQQAGWADALEADALKADAAGWDCYFSTCPSAKAKTSSTRIRKDEVAFLPGLFMDVDTESTKAGKSVPKDIDAAVNALKAHPYPPTALVSSGHGVHAYWKLAEAIPVSNAQELQHVAKCLSGFAETTSRAIGFADLDTSASEPARVLRLPGTHNHKGEPLPVTLLEMTGKAYPFKTLNGLAGTIERKPEETTPRTFTPAASTRYTLPGTIPQGGRNNELFTYGRSLRSWGAGDDEVRAALHEANRTRCNPPLPDSDINAIARSVNTKPPGNELRRERTEAAPAPGERLTLADLHPEDNARYHWTDIGNGRLFADWYKDVARYVPERKGWFIFNGKAWERDESDLHVMKLCKRLADRLLKYATTIADEKKKMDYLRFVGKWQGRSYRETILKDARDAYPVNISAFDVDPFLFNCQNGTLNLKTGEFHQHRASDLLSKVSGVNYDPAATCTRWERFIDEVMLEDTDKAEFLQKALGYALTGETKYECFFVLYGPTSRNGKGTTMETFMRLMGDYGRAGQPESLAQHTKAGNAPTEDIARLAGARFVNFAESGKKMIISAALVKSLTGNDTITARFLNENSFEYRPQFKLFINTNHLPTVSDVTLFSSGRVKIIPFERHFSEAEQDSTLKQVLAQSGNLSGILNWCLAGLRKIATDGFAMPQSVREATDDYRTNSDRLGRFLEDETEAGELFESSTNEVYARYQWWCARNGFRPDNIAVFKSSLENVATIKKQRPAGAGRGVNPVSLILGYRLKPRVTTLLQGGAEEYPAVM